MFSSNLISKIPLYESHLIPTFTITSTIISTITSTIISTIISTGTDITDKQREMLAAKIGGEVGDALKTMGAGSAYATGSQVSLSDYISILLVSNFMWSAALDSSALVL